jgi:type IV pilus assembly protein PilP
MHLEHSSHRVLARHARTVVGLPVLGLLLVLAPACGDEEEDSAPAAPAAAAAPAAEQVATTTEAAKEDESLVYTYNAVGKRDPFRTYFSEIENEDAVNRKLTELQQYDLDQLRLVAVIVGTATPKAMVEDPTGKGHVVKTGTLIGKHWGQIKHIRRGEVIIQEEFRDFTGRRVTHLVPMKLPEEEKVKLE